MFRACIRPTSFTGVLLFAIACRDPMETSPSQTRDVDLHAFGAHLDVLRAQANTIDSRFAQIDSAVPGFAGFFRDDAGIIRIKLTDPSRLPDARAALKKFYAGDVSRANFIQELDRAIADSASYSFAYLLSQKYQYYKLGDLKDVVYVDIDEVSNRLTVAVNNERAVAYTNEVLARSGVPLAATKVFVTCPFELATAYLNDKIRPAAGGLSITTYRSDTIATLGCTLGLNIRLFSGDSRPSWLTASHCLERVMHGRRTV